MFEDYEELARRFTYEVEMEVYLNSAGLRSVVNTAQIYERYAPLFTEQKVRTFKNAAQNYTGEERERARRLYLFACENYLENAVKVQRDALLTKEATMEVSIDGEKCLFRFLSTKIQNEENRTERKKLYEIELGAVREMNPLQVEIMKALHGKAVELGYPDYYELYRNLKQVDFTRLRDTLNRFLASTENLYVDAMNRWLDKYKLSLGELERHDIAFVFAGTEFDRYFPAENMMNELAGATAAMGMDITKLKGSERNVIIDLEQRPTKSPRAFVSAVDPPFEIYMVVMPQGGVSDYLSVFHESGHALHYAFVVPSLPFVYKKIGESSVSETYAFLFEYLLTNPLFVEKRVKGEALKEYLQYQMLYKLYMVRRYIGKLNYELQLHRAKDLEKMGGVYKREMERALHFQHPEEIFLADIDHGFYSADYLRAWIFEPMLRRKMEELYGERWFEKEDAGRYLRALWSVGEKHSVEELARNINMEELNPRYLEEELRQGLE
ncbi:MAG: M3 family metallopeptidase [Thermoplasmata archaeon]|nr:M3 family metallopeptidase [Thermoplasmata archaeon]